MKKSNFLDLLFKNASYIAVVLISVAYVASSLVLISKTGRGVYEILGSGALSLIVGILINSTFRDLGIRRAEQDERTISTKALHEQTVEQITPFIDRLDGFCEKENERALKRIRARILLSAGLRYEDCFDERGATMDLDSSLLGADKTKNKRILKAYKKAQAVRVKPLSSFLLTCDSTSYNNPYDFGKSKREFDMQRGASDIMTRVVMAIIFGYFGVSLVSEVNVATIIWNVLQIVMYVTSGIIGMYSSYSFIVDEHRTGIIKKIDVLQKFKLYVDKNPQDV